MSEELPTDAVELEPDLPPGQEAEDDAPKTRTIKRSALAQGSNVPLGWKPSLQKPVPVVRCNYVWPDDHPLKAGQRCNRWSLRGSLLCYIHSGRGNLKNVEEYRQAILESARLQMTDSVPDAVEWLIDLAANSGADAVRLKAITELLDRTGLKLAQESNVNVNLNDVTQNPLTTLSDRLEKLKSAAAAVDLLKQKAEEEKNRLALEAAKEDEDIVDAEIVEDEPE